MIPQGPKEVFTNEDRRQMLDLLQSWPNTGGLQSMLMSGGPISADNMAALIAKLRELDTAKLPENIQDKLNHFDRASDKPPHKLKDNAPDIKDTLADFQMRQLLALNGSTNGAQDMAKNAFGPSNVQAEVAASTASQSPGLNPLQPQGPGPTFQNNQPGLRMDRV